MYRNNIYYSYFTMLYFEVMVYVTVTLSCLDSWNLVKLFVIETKLSLQFVILLAECGPDLIYCWQINNKQFGNKFPLLVIIFMNVIMSKIILSLKLCSHCYE
jgi:hypothetical protein